MTTWIGHQSQKSALLVSWFLSFGKRYEIDLRVIFYQWPKLGLGLDVEAEIQILKVFYTIKWSFGTLHFYAEYIGFCIPERKTPQLVLSSAKFRTQIKWLLNHLCKWWSIKGKVSVDFSSWKRKNVSSSCSKSSLFFMTPYSISSLEQKKIKTFF